MSAQSDPVWSLRPAMYLGRGTSYDVVVENDGRSQNLFFFGSVHDLTIGAFYRIDNVQCGARAGVERIKGQLIGMGLGEVRVRLKERRWFDRFSIAFGKGFGTIQNNVDFHAGFAFIGGIQIVNVGHKQSWSITLEDRFQIFHVKYVFIGPNGISYPVDTGRYLSYNSIGITFAREISW